MIDLRSDTVTKPTEEMKRFMLKAEVGDSVYQEDPTVNKLQQKVADLMNKEAALFVVSGTMSNQLAIKAQTSPGDEVIVEQKSHPFQHEGGGAGLISGITFYTINKKRGIIEPKDVKKAIRVKTNYYAKTSLLMIENTHNFAGGIVFPIEIIKDLYTLTKKNNLAMHIDGARIFNASVASGIKVAEYAKYTDTISFCFSKGLGAPIGSMIVGSKEVIEKIDKYRTMLGGAWRQAGILAAAAIFALDNNIDRLAEDHENAQFFAKNIETIDELELIEKPETNIVIFRLKKTKLRLKTKNYLKKWSSNGLLLGLIDDKEIIRAVFHLQVSQKQTKEAVEIIKKSFLTLPKD